MSSPPHVPAAFINAIWEEGTKDEACKYLQKQWNECCQLRDENKSLLSQLAAARAAQDNLRHELSRLRNRPADEPGGMECQKCGCIFVGSEADAECGVCCLKSQLAAARAKAKITFEKWQEDLAGLTQITAERDALIKERDTAYAKAREDAAKVVEGYDLKMTQLVWASERPDDFVMKCLAHIATAIRNLP